MIFIAAAMTLAVVIVTLLSCVSDVRAMQIPNTHCLVILGCFIPAWLAAPEVFQPLWTQLAGFGLVLVAGYVLFAIGVMGGGDSKLAAALGLWVGLRGLMPFVFYWALAGGVLAMLTLFLRKKKPFQNPAPGSWIAQAQTGGNAIPYGIAISVGAWAAFVYTGLVHHQLNEVFKIIH